jgi:hypothetical protein
MKHSWCWTKLILVVSYLRTATASGWDGWGDNRHCGEIGAGSDKYPVIFHMDVHSDVM